MRYVSTFSGIEAASVAWEPLGWEPMAFCEIDEFPSAVLAHHYPEVPNLGDITKVDWREFVNEHGRPDVVVGGSPCQSFSVAAGASRTSLGGASRLMFEYIRALAEIRPRFFLWENVPGVLNTRDNAFAQLLGEVQDLGYGSVAWRVLDAQFFGVAQRRRRVFLVGHLGTGGSAAAVLFESESVRGNTQTSKQKRESLSRAAGRGSSSGGRAGSLNGWDVQPKRIFPEDGVAPTLNSGEREGGGIQPSVLQSAGFCGYASHTAKSIGYAEETAPTLKGNDWQAQVPNVLQATAIRTANTSANGCGRSEAQASNGEDICGALCARDYKGVGSQFVSEGQVICQPMADYPSPAICLQTDHLGQNGTNAHVEVSKTLDTKGAPAVAYAVRMREGKAGGGKGPLVQTDISGTIATGNDQTILCKAGTQFGEEIAGTLTRRADSSPCADRGQNVVFCRANSQSDATTTCNGVAHTVTCLHDQQIVAYEPIAVGDSSANASIDANMSGTLHVGGNPSFVSCHDGSRWTVRRLTPTECERLQGFPDGWTDVPFNGKEHPSDTPRYKAIGNSMAVPVMRWIGERIEFVDKIMRE